MRPTGKSSAACRLPASFSGLVWSADGKRLFAGGGFDDRIYRFDHADGLALEQGVVRVSRPQGVPGGAESGGGRAAKKYQRVPAGLALTKDGKTLYVAAAFGHSRGPVRRRVRRISRRNPARGR